MPRARLRSRVVLAAALVLATACARQPARPNVLLVTIDTLRADHVGCYGFERDTTPNLDGLAEEGLRFTHAQAPRSKTTPSVTSVLTGLYPHEHGVRDLASPLSPQVPLVQQRLSRAGWRTGAIVGNWVLTDEQSGLARGFDLWVEDLPDVRGVPPHDAPQRTAGSMTDGALVALGLEPPPAAAASTSPPGPDGPFVSSVLPDPPPWFLWLHYMDPHGAYAPPEEHRVFRSEPDPIPAPPGPDEPPRNPPHPHRVADYNVPPEARLEDGRVDAAHVRDLYDAEVRYVDAELGRLFEALRAAGLLETTLVIVTADHGESLGEHRYWFEHGMYPYENTCRVPLIVRFPDAYRGRPANGVVAADVSLVDLAPTLLDLFGLGAPPATPGGLRGSSLRAVLFEDAEVRRPVFCEKVERADKAGVVQSKAVRLGDWKLIRRYAAKPRLDRPRERELVLLAEELYELRSDPNEERNLAQAPPAAAHLEELRALLADYTDADVELVDLDMVLQRRREALERDDPEALRVLDALGY